MSGRVKRKGPELGRRGRGRGLGRALRQDMPATHSDIKAAIATADLNTAETLDGLLLLLLLQKIHLMSECLLGTFLLQHPLHRLRI